MMNTGTVKCIWHHSYKYIYLVQLTWKEQVKNHIQSLATAHSLCMANDRMIFYHT